MPQINLSQFHWRFADKMLPQTVIGQLNSSRWKAVKTHPKRIVYSAGPYFVKVYNFSGFTGFLKKKIVNGARKEWNLSTRLIAKNADIPKPIALGISQRQSVFVSTSIEPCLTAFRFTNEKWNHLNQKEKYLVVDIFSNFILRLFKAGLFQRDFNLGNILITKDYSKIFAIDLQTAKLINRPLTEKEVAKNLSYLMPCFMLVGKRIQLRFFIFISKFFPLIKPFINDIQNWAFARKRKQWMKKTPRKIRESSRQINYFAGSITSGYIQSDVDTGIKNILMEDPGRLFEKVIKYYKKSKRSTVALIELYGQKLILKQYNLKSSFHKIRRFFSPSLAYQIWKNTHLFSARMLPTAKLAGIVDLGKGFDYLATFAIYEHINGAEKSKELLREKYLDKSERQATLRKLAKLLWRMHQSGVYHGDAKISNFLWIEKNGRTEIKVIDLDSIIFCKRVNNRQRLDDINNMAASLAWWNIGRNIGSDFLAEYIKYHQAWSKKKAFWTNRLEKKINKQLMHRKKRQKT